VTTSWIDKRIQSYLEKLVFYQQENKRNKIINAGLIGLFMNCFVIIIFFRNLQEEKDDHPEVG